MSRVILGVNSVYHESAACLLVDGTMVAFVEEERFNRIRHGKRSFIDNSDELPWASIDFCLQHAGLNYADVDGIGYSFDPDLRLKTHLDMPDKPAEGWGSEDGERNFHAHNMTAKAKLLERMPKAEFFFLGHHLSHAASAYLVSPFDQAAVLVIDGIGEVGSTWLGLGEGEKMTELETVDFPHSMGFVWEFFSQFLGFDAYSGPGKVMGYAAITDPEGELTGKDHLAAMRQILRPEPDGTFFVDAEAFRFRTQDFSGLEKHFGPRRLNPVDRYEDASVAAALQEVTNDIMVHLCDRLYERINANRDQPVTDLCLAGGVALNCVANYQVAARSKFRRIWVQPAANDAGTAVGAAALVDQQLGGHGRPKMEHAYWGPGYSNEQVLAAIEAEGLTHSSPNSMPAEVARRIEQGQIVAWFQGRQEVGPRALGHRSIVCDPSRFDSRTRLNTRVKYRESYRPFAPSCLQAAVDRFFEWPADMMAARFMLFALPLKEKLFKQVLPAVMQENASTGLATSRIHLVDEEHSPEYAALIHEFDKLTGLPIVLNTSFNIREPIVTSPAEAIRTFLNSSMDALALGPYLLPHPKAD